MNKVKQKNCTCKGRRDAFTLKEQSVKKNTYLEFSSSIPPPLSTADKKKKKKKL